MPKSAMLAPFRSPVPTISHCDVLGFNLGTFKKLLKNSQSSYNRCFFFRKNVVSLAYATYKNFQMVYRFI